MTEARLRDIRYWTAYVHGAAEMRERAAQALDEHAPWAAAAIRALPLRPEEMDITCIDKPPTH
jgi:hypothetical protein